MTRFTKVFCLITATALFVTACGKGDEGTEAIAAEPTSIQAVEVRQASPTDDPIVEITEEDQDANPLLSANTAQDVSLEELAKLAERYGKGEISEEEFEEVMARAQMQNTPQASEQAPSTTESQPAMAPSGNSLMVWFNGVEHPMNYTMMPVCDGFNFSDAPFIRGLPRDAKERMPSLFVRGTSESVSITFELARPVAFDPNYVPEANFLLVKVNGETRAYELISGQSGRGPEISLSGATGLALERNKLTYNGPYAGNSQDTIRIEATYCSRQ